MNIVELFALAVALSMDAFAVAVCAGLTMKKFSLKKALVIGLYFGLFQALMPLLGFLVAAQFAEIVSAIDHWVAFVLLSVIGGKMIYGAIFDKVGECDCKIKNCACGKEQKEFSIKPVFVIPLAFATSIDALAAGVLFALNDVNAVPAAALIGVITFVLSAVGVKVGSVFGVKFKAKAEIVGGIVLIAIGLRIFFGH